MFKKDYERSPQEKAQRAKMSVIARLGGCAYLIYIMVQLLKTPANEVPKSSWITVVAIVMLVLSAGVIIITLMDLFRALKTGRFDAATYEDEANFPCNPAEDETEAEALEEHTEDDDTVDEDDAEDDEEYDDEDDDGEASTEKKSS